MLLLVCPRCSRLEPRRLEFCSEDAIVDYYRCDACGNVFIVAKGPPDGPVRQIRQITIVPVQGRSPG